MSQTSSCCKPHGALHVHHRAHGHHDIRRTKDRNVFNGVSSWQTLGETDMDSEQFVSCFEDRQGVNAWLWIFVKAALHERDCLLSGQKGLSHTHS